MTLVSSLGFDGPKLRFALRTALAACLALLVAGLLGLEHPQWAAMTVWAASQPTRGQLVEKSIFRVAGTISGVAAGIVLIMMSVDRPYILVSGLAVWTALCAGIGNIQRGFVAYGTILAGYSAAMVSLLDVGHPTAHVLELGADRFLTVLTGVAIAFVVGWLFTPRDASDAVLTRVHLLAARVMRDLALDPAERGGLADEMQALLSEMAALDEMLDPHFAGDLRSRRTVRAIRTLLASQLSALLWLRSSEATAASSEVRRHLSRAGRKIEGHGRSGVVLDAVKDAIAAAGASPLQTVLKKLESALAAFLSEEKRADPVRVHQPVVLHRDWAGGWQAMIRTLVSMLTVGALWLATGWSSGPFMLLGLAVMTSLFSTFDNPALMMRTVLLGQVIGVIGFLCCRWLAWPLASGRMELILLIVPFILIGAFVLAHRRTAPLGFDYNMVMLLLLQPAYPPAGDVGQSLAAGFAVVSAPIVAWLSYKGIYPVDGRTRMNMLIAAMVHDLQDMAGSRKRTDTSFWRARLYHRLLRLVRSVEKTGAKDVSVVDAGLGVLNVGSAIRSMREMLAMPSLPLPIRRRLTVALARSRDIATNPVRTQQAFARSAAELRKFNRSEAALLTAAAADIGANDGFFRRGASKTSPAFIVEKLARRAWHGDRKL